VNDGSVAAGAREESLRAAAPIGPRGDRLMLFGPLMRGLGFWAPPQLHC
jgi:hypothetical protein